MTIENKNEPFKSFLKPQRNVGYDEIAKRVNKEIVVLGDDGDLADIKLINKKIGLSKGSCFDIRKYVNYFAIAGIG